MKSIKKDDKTILKEILPPYPKINSKYKTEECRDFKFTKKCT